MECEMPCPHEVGVVVDIRPAKDGLPDPDVVLGSYAVPVGRTVPADGPWPYTAARMNLALPVGTYFAILRPSRPGTAVDAAVLSTLQAGSGNAVYRAGTIPVGFLSSYTAGSLSRGLRPMAIRVLAEPLAPASPHFTSKQCKRGGYKHLVNPDSGRPFKNQGQCVRFTKRHP